ncbi:MAG TPA: phosphoglycerate mutase family protein [Allosphingosinicella sp.]|uniref:phosphoglycerate mutase family protein n=1 Tax=Allosphingosinicella sp. TaxID=2823234 RepID=UPI002EDA690E
MLHRLVAGFALLLLAACFPVAPQVPLGPSYYVMRHLNTPQGVQDPDLTAEGQRLAALLPGFFQDDPPRTIFVSNTKRAQQTAEPLARALGITPRIYDPSDTAALVRMVQAETGGAVLVVGHSNTVPDIVEQLGGTRPAPLTHPDFGDIWHISPATGSTLKLRIDG